MNAVFNQLVNERGGHGALWVAELAPKQMKHRWI
jgi:hypothetical protein